MAEKPSASSVLIEYVAFWGAITAAIWLTAFITMSPQNCHEVTGCERSLEKFPTRFNAYSAAGLGTMLIHELVNVVSTHFGVQETKAVVPNLQSKVLPALLLSVMFATLGAAHFFYADIEATVAHVMPNVAPGRAVWTMNYLEWCIDVPILFLLSGHCALGRPLQEMTGPVIATNAYIVFCWSALVAESELVRWSLISISVATYVWVSRDMLRWVTAYERTAPSDLPSRGFRPMLTVLLIALFFVYGIIYTLSAARIIAANSERFAILVVTLGAKIGFSVAFVIIRASEYHTTLTSVLRTVTVSNVGMISILRGSFDIIIPCKLDLHGHCKLPLTYSGDMSKLESILCRPVGGSNFVDLLRDEEKDQFSAYVRNVLRQAEMPQTFSDATLSVQGEWNSGQMPPIAQVLNAKMGCGQENTATKQMDVSIHLSVVPRSAMSFGRERQLVAAIQFVTREVSEETGTEHTEPLAMPAFENFTEDKDSKEGSTRPGSSEKSGEHSLGIVANLADLAKLGVSTLLQGSVAGDAEAQTWDDGASSAYFSNSGSSISHLGALAMMEAASKAHEDQRLYGTWRGFVSKTFGGYEQCLKFLKDGVVQVEVMDKIFDGRYTINVGVEPAQLDLQVFPAGNATPPPAIPYIYKFEAGTLCICGPGSATLRRPRSFDGPGLCILRRSERGPGVTLPELEEEAEKLSFKRWSTEESVGSAQNLGSAFSRNSTEDTSSETRDGCKQKMLATSNKVIVNPGKRIEDVARIKKISSENVSESSTAFSVQDFLKTEVKLSAPQAAALGAMAAASFMALSKALCSK